MLEQRYDDLKFHQDFIGEKEISINWLLSQFYGTNKKFQITKISNEMVIDFLLKLKESNLFIPPQNIHALEFIREKLEKNYEMSRNQHTKSWENITLKYKYILSQVSQVLISMRPEELEYKEPEINNDIGNFNVEFE